MDGAAVVLRGGVQEVAWTGGVDVLDEGISGLAGGSQLHSGSFPTVSGPPLTPRSHHGNRASGSIEWGGLGLPSNGSCDASWVAEYSFHRHITFPARCHTLRLSVFVWQFGSGVFTENKDAWAHMLFSPVSAFSLLLCGDTSHGPNMNSLQERSTHVLA